MQIQGRLNRQFNINNKIINVFQGEVIEVGASEGRRIVLNGAGIEIKEEVKAVSKEIVKKGRK